MVARSCIMAQPTMQIGLLCAFDSVNSASNLTLELLTRMLAYASLHKPPSANEFVHHCRRSPGGPSHDSQRATHRSSQKLCRTGSLSNSLPRKKPPHGRIRG